jgi:hypothetical protein
MTEAPDEEFSTADRQLCPDGSCTGLIGDDGKCKVCGRSADGSSARSDGEPPAARDGDGDSDEAEPDFDRGVAPDFDEERQLCVDGNCTGLIGSDGKCKVCGLPAQAS